MNKNEAGKYATLIASISNDLLDAHKVKTGVDIVQVHREYCKAKKFYDRLWRLFFVLLIVGVGTGVFVGFLLTSYSGYTFKTFLVTVTSAITPFLLWLWMMTRAQNGVIYSEQPLQDFEELIKPFRREENVTEFLTKETVEKNMHDLAQKIIVGGEFLQRLEAKGVTTFDFGIQNQINVARDRMNTATGRASKIGLTFNRRSMLQSVHDQMINAEKAAAAKV